MGENMTDLVKPNPLTKPSIDWSHVAKGYKWLAMDRDGTVWLFAEEPDFNIKMWCGNGATLASGLFASCTSGTCDCRDSLVERPE